MARAARRSTTEMTLEALRAGWSLPATARFRGGVTTAAGIFLILAIATYNAADPSLNVATPLPPTNALGLGGAVIADVAMQSLGLGSRLCSWPRKQPQLPRRRSARR